MMVHGVCGPESADLIRLAEGVYATEELGYSELVNQHYRRSVACYTLTLGDSLTEVVSHLQLESIVAGLSSHAGELLDIFQRWMSRQPSGITVTIGYAPGQVFERTAVHNHTAYYLNPPWAVAAVMECTKHLLLYSPSHFLLVCSREALFECSMHTKRLLNYVMVVTQKGSFGHSCPLCLIGRGMGDFLIDMQKKHMRG